MGRDEIIAWTIFGPMVSVVPTTQGVTAMATFDKRVDKDRKTFYRVRVRRKGSAPQIATFHKLADAKTWAQVTEGAVLEGRHFKTAEAKRHIMHERLGRNRRKVGIEPIGAARCETVNAERQCA